MGRAFPERQKRGPAVKLYMMSGMMNCFLDTNLLVYAVDPRNPDRRKTAVDLLKALINEDTLVLSPQSLSECFRALRPSCHAVLDGDTVLTAISLQAAYKTQWFDSVLLASALGAACKVFWSEDMQQGQIIGGMRILNPFVTPPETILQK
jgi:predicted nucleic acid-binding protein